MIPYYEPEVSTDSTFMTTFKSSLPVHNVKIPKKIMKRVIEGNQNRKYVTLTCAVKPGRLWAAHTVGRKLSFGWEKFAKDNSFDDGDLLLFKYNGRTRFHVERFSSVANNVDLAGRVSPTVFFCTVNGLHKFAGKEIAMLGEDGTSFDVKLKTQSFLLRRRLQLKNGLREFFEENDIHPNDQITFELLQDNMSLPKLKLHSKVILVPN